MLYIGYQFFAQLAELMLYNRSKAARVTCC